MSLRRLTEVARLTMRANLRRPAIFILVFLMVLIIWGLSAGNVRISSGDSSVGGTKAWLTSEFAITQLTIFLSFLLYFFFAAVAAGSAVIQDDEDGTSELLHATPLRPAEYIWGKFFGVVGAFLAVLAVHLVAFIVFFQFLPNDQADEIRGPFSLVNYLRPLLLFGLPNVLFAAGLAFFIGERSRRPVFVMTVPLAIFLLCLFFLWNWAPTWLDPRINRLLMIVDPSGFRWLNETWLKLDRGVDFYNGARVPLDVTFFLNRLWILVVALGGVALAPRHLARVISGAATARKGKVAAGPTPNEGTAALLLPRPIAHLGMRSAGSSFWAQVGEIARAEVRELRSQPGLYLFVPLILLQILGTSLIALGPFGTRVLLTSGQAAVGAVNIITLSVCLLLLFYTVESLNRERATGLDGVFYASPVRSSAMLFGKCLANSLVGVVILAAAFLGSAIAILVQGKTPLVLGPFFLVWGLLLIPTFLLWTSFVAALYSFVRERYTTYALALAALAASGYFQATGKMTWVFNWNLWGALQWTDMGPFQLARSALVMNRALALLATVFLVAVAVRLFPRRSLDASQVFHRLRPQSLLRFGIRLLPLVAAPLALGFVLDSQVRHGFQGQIAEKKSKDYWRKNLATFRDIDMPSVRHVDLDVVLEPAKSRFVVDGEFVLFNHHDKVLTRIPFTADPAWDKLTWTLDGVALEPTNRVGLHVFSPEGGFAPGAEWRIGFHVEGTHPSGITKNGGGTAQFILPAGVVLHVFQPTFMPLPGYIESVGIDKDNRYESKEFPSDYWKEELEPAFGQRLPMSTFIRVTVPEEYRANSVGERIEDTVRDGKRTTVWRSEYPVRFFNIVAGKWDVKEGEGTALYYHPEHDYNIDEISRALDAARKYYSEWFRPFPWKELKISEFPALASYAQGFPTNITFSEGIGFLAKSDKNTNVAFLVTAHESAHQWWGNLLTPGLGPGANILSEGMAHYSTILLIDQVLGERDRIAFCRRIEERYGDNRQVDSERPLVKIDGTRDGDTTVTYDKGGWVMWMLHDLMGREATLAGLQEFHRRFGEGPDYPLLEDLVETLRPFAPDAAAFQEFVDQWFFGVLVPEYRFASATKVAVGDGFTTTAALTNRGTGRMTLEVAVERGKRWPETSGAANAGKTSTGSAFRQERIVVVLDAGEETQVTIHSDFEPERLLVDPEARVLQLNRDQAIVRF